MTVPAATTRYSGTSRLTVLPSVAIGTLNGSANTASSGNASARRRITTTSAVITTSAMASPAASVPALGRRVASTVPGDGAHGATNVKLAGSSTGPW